jgi:hypothetical protein
MVIIRFLFCLGHASLIWFITDKVLELIDKHKNSTHK